MSVPSTRTICIFSMQWSFDVRYASAVMVVNVASTTSADGRSSSRRTSAGAANAVAALAERYKKVGGRHHVSV